MIQDMKILKYSLIALAIAALSTSCATEREKMDEHHFSNKLYVETGAPVEELLVKPGSVTEFERTLKVSTALKMENKVTARFVADVSLLDTYKKAFYADDVVALPSELCNIPQPDVTIDEGSSSSAPVSIFFEGLDALDRETIYVMPVSLVDVEGIDVLDSKTVVYYVFRGADLINIVADLKENRAYPDFNDDPDYNNMTNFTFEALVKPNQFPNMLHTIMGIEGHFLLRSGDSGIEPNQLQVATNNGNISSTDCQFEVGKWCHVAVTFAQGEIKIYFNGALKHSGNNGQASQSFGAKHHNEEDGSRVFWVGYSYESNRYWDGLISEVRIWNRTLTQEEINAPNHFYTVDVNSEGLLSYWKFNEGSGNKIKDYGPKGYDLTVDNSPTWVNVALPERSK